MKRLTAQYSIELGGVLVVKRPDGETPVFSALIDGFKIEVSIPERFVSGVRSREERLVTHACYLVEVSVSREESGGPPPPGRTEQGGIDYTVQSAYFSSRVSPYARVAAETLNRLFLFLRHRLRQPLLDEITPDHHALQNPKWVDETGAAVGKGPMVFVGMGVPRQYGVIPLQTKHGQKLNRALNRRLVPKLYEEILADAQSAALRGNLRRAILELAIACEVAVKRKFFGGSSGGRTIEYLEDKGHFQVPVVELIGKASESVFGETFRNTHEKQHKDIEHLFQCRNKVAHRGQTIFRPSGMPMQTVTPEILEQWFSSARKLFIWLRKLRHR